MRMSTATPQFTADFDGCFRRPHFSTLAFYVRRSNLSPDAQIIEAHREGNMELAFVIVVVVVAGAMIPGNPKVQFYR